MNRVTAATVVIRVGRRRETTWRLARGKRTRKIWKRIVSYSLHCRRCWFAVSPVHARTRIIFDGLRVVYSDDDDRKNTYFRFYFSRTERTKNEMTFRHLLFSGHEARSTPISLSSSRSNRCNIRDSKPLWNGSIEDQRIFRKKKKKKRGDEKLLGILDQDRWSFPFWGGFRLTGRGSSGTERSYRND